MYQLLFLCQRLRLNNKISSHIFFSFIRVFVLYFVLVVVIIIVGVVEGREERSKGVEREVEGGRG